jgi:hypothetical protein
LGRGVFVFVGPGGFASGGGGGTGEEMTQTLYAHINKIKIKKNLKTYL